MMSISTISSVRQVRYFMHVAQTLADAGRHETWFRKSCVVAGATILGELMDNFVGLEKPAL